MISNRRWTPLDYLAYAKAHNGLYRRAGIPFGPYYKDEAKRVYEALVRRLTITVEPNPVTGVGHPRRGSARP